MAARDSFRGTRGPRLPGVLLRVVAALLLMPHGAQMLFGSPAGPPPRHPQGACIHKGIGLRRMPGQRQRLSFSYDLRRLATAMRQKRGYEVTELPGGNEVRITRRFDGVKYSIIFEGGDPLSFTVISGEERCATPNRRIKRRAYRMIGDLPFEARQKAELELHVTVLSYAWFSDAFRLHPHSPNPPD